MLYVKIAIALLLLITIYQDFKERAIYWFISPILLGLFCINGISTFETKLYLTNSSLNIAFLLIQLIIVTLYFSIKKNKITNITNDYLGLGDILIFIAFCFAFSPVNYIVFLLLGLILTLFLTVVYSNIKKTEIIKIPLAGYISSFYLFFLIAKTIISYNEYDDTFLIEKIIFIY